MLTRIGRQEAPSTSTGDAVDLLLECHARIRSFVALAGRIAEAPAGEPGVADAAARVRRYFSEALPLHARDEEESILPRLHGREPPLDAALDAMAREHREHEAPLERLLALCATLAESPERLPEVAPALARVAAELTAHFDVHLAAEEAVVLPAMRRLLDGGQQAAIVTELRERRRA